MSVINQMLIDLENRRAPATDRGPLGGHVRPLPAVPSARVPTWVISAGAALVIGTLVGFGAHRWMPRQSAADALVPGAGEATVAAPAAAPVDAVAAESTPAAVGEASPEAAEPQSRAAPPRRAEAAATDGPAKSRKDRDKDRAAKRKDKDRERVAADQPASTRVAQVEPQAVAVAPAPIAAAAVAVPAPVQAATSAPAAKPASLFPGDLEVKVSPAQRVENEFRQALNAMAQGRTAEAQELLGRVLAATPLHDGARHALVGLMLRERKPAAAEALADDRLARDPDHPGFAQISARLKLDRGDAQAALATLTRTLPHAHASAEFLAFRAAVLQRLARHGEAIEDYAAALKLQPQTAVWNMGLAISLQALERRADALDAYRRARAGPGLAPELQAFVDQRVRLLERP